MTALEAKRAADNFNQDLYNSVLNKISIQRAVMLDFLSE